MPPRSPLPPAFTLVELLVVIAIIGILSALFLPVLVRDKEKAQGKRTVLRQRSRPGREDRTGGEQPLDEPGRGLY